MRTLIVGAGALGGIIGARLLAADASVKIAPASGYCFPVGERAVSMQRKAISATRRNSALVAP